MDKSYMEYQSAITNSQDHFTHHFTISDDFSCERCPWENNNEGSWTVQKLENLGCDVEQYLGNETRIENQGNSKSAQKFLQNCRVSFKRNKTQQPIQSQENSQKYINVQKSKQELQNLRKNMIVIQNPYRKGENKEEKQIQRLNIKFDRNTEFIRRKQKLSSSKDRKNKNQQVDAKIRQNMCKQKHQSSSNLKLGRSFVECRRVSDKGPKFRCVQSQQGQQKAYSQFPNNEKKQVLRFSVQKLKEFQPSEIQNRENFSISECATKFRQKHILTQGGNINLDLNFNRRYNPQATINFNRSISQNQKHRSLLKMFKNEEKTKIYNSLISKIKQIQIKQNNLRPKENISCSFIITNKKQKCMIRNNSVKQNQTSKIINGYINDDLPLLRIRSSKQSKQNQQNIHTEASNKQNSTYKSVLSSWQLHKKQSQKQQNDNKIKLKIIFNKQKIIQTK